MSRDTLELFEGVDFGVPRPSLAKARELVEAVEELGVYEGIDFCGHCERLASEARRLGAHAVARIVRVYPRIADSWGYDSSQIAAERAANRWLARVETAATQPQEASS